MHLFFPAVWPLVASLACLGAVVNAGGMLEIDVIFPRNNETYAPTRYFPIVFALQNAELARYLAPYIEFVIRNASDSSSAFGDGYFDLTNANLTSEPYFVYTWRNIDTEGPYQLFTSTYWQGCNETGDQVERFTDSINFGIEFTIKSGAQKVDLVAATANDTTCSARDGVVLNVTGRTHEVFVETWRSFNTTCMVLASSSPTPTANPCRVKIDTVVDASMSAYRRSRECDILKNPNPPADCPADENGVQPLAVAGIASFAAALGAVAFLLRTTQEYCDVLFAQWLNQPSPSAAEGPGRACSDCLLGVLQLQLNSPFGYDPDFASDFASRTSSCSKTGYAFTSPPPYTVTATGTSSSSPSAFPTGMLDPGCVSLYTIQVGDTCNSIAQAQNVSTFAVYGSHGITDCSNLPAGSKLCLLGQCLLHEVRETDTCDSIIAGAGITVSASIFVA
ncbi:hypothetical protein N0V88_008108 [Collariella sp. IMI 366227]|nr:hypothetical protein N0V88_008108 [Collariella sp. IMI 366227]